MCSVSTNGEQASPAQQGFQLIFLKTFDKHANILVKSLPEYQELVHIMFINVYLGWPLALRLLVDRYPQILHIYTHVNSYMLMR